MTLRSAALALALLALASGGAAADRGDAEKTPALQLTPADFPERPCPPGQPCGPPPCRPGDDCPPPPCHPREDCPPPHFPFPPNGWRHQHRPWRGPQDGLPPPEGWPHHKPHHHHKHGQHGHGWHHAHHHHSWLHGLKHRVKHSMHSLTHSVRSMDGQVWLALGVAAAVATAGALAVALALAYRRRTRTAHGYAPVGASDTDEEQGSGKDGLAVATTFSSSLAARTAQPSRTGRRSVVVRAEGADLAKVERVAKVGGLYKNFTSGQALSYLDGTLPGDFGFDPLGLCDPEGAGGFITPEWLSYSEVIHGRWAMLGAAGFLAPEVLATAGLIPASPEEAVWFRSGVIPPAGQYGNYWMDPYSLFWIEAILMNFAELKRWQDFKEPGSQSKQYFLGLEAVFAGSGNPAYPGGQWFNMLNLGKTPEAMKKLQTNEIRNGRLAMIACLGCAAQGVMTQKGPFANLLEHLADPVSNNLLGNLSTIMKH